jgi:integrase
MRTNAFYQKGKHGNDTLIRRSREQIRTYILFMENTGLRAGTEVRSLRWRDIEFAETTEGQKYIRVAVPSSGKSRRPKQAIGRFTARRALERMRQRRTDNVDADDYIVCHRNGAPAQHFREIFDAVIEEAGVKYHLDGDRKIKYTPYCLRHTYITFRLRYTKNLNLLSLARQCGTSLAMIESNYDATLPEEHLDEFL